MLPKLFSVIDRNTDVFVHKFCNFEDVSRKGAFAYGSVINFEVSISRRLGAREAVMRICRDGFPDRDIPLSFRGSDGIHDVYSMTLDTAELCKEEQYGLFYYEFLLLRGANTLFTDTYNNCDFNLAQHSGTRFKMLVYEPDFKTPEAFGRGVMYHVFVDRFFRGETDKVRNIKIRDNAVANLDWDNGIPQYAKKAGDPLKNNEFFGGTLWGVAEKLDYLQSLGVTYIYLSPIFEAYSNHKYDTGDYLKVDEMFGGDEAFDNLVAKARERGMGIILDGVFNHTGDDSIYFNKYQNHGLGGAYNDPSSKYRNWYCFKEYPEKYESWWGIDILPKLNHSCDACREFFTGDKGVIRKYIKRGIAGWRLDVADELDDRFLDTLREGAKDESGGDAVIIGEVWENACDKVAYGVRRRYFAGRQLDSVMNYPLRNAIISFCLYADGEHLYNTLTELYSSYPEQCSHKLMNLLGTHDTERIMTTLGSDMDDYEGDNCELATRRLSPEKRKRGIELQKIASVIQYTAFGIPSLYYGDEVGLEGYHDPFCRMPFPWNKLDGDGCESLMAHYKRLGEIRRDEKAFDGGRFYVIGYGESFLVYAREKEDSLMIIALNRGEAFEMEIPECSIYRELLTGIEYTDKVTIESDSAKIFKRIVK